MEKLIGVEKLIVTGRVFYGIAIAIAAVGFQQCFYADFHPMVLPPGHAWLPALGFWAWFSGIALLASGGADPYYKHLGEWGEAEKELALAGGGFVIAGSFSKEDQDVQPPSLLIRFLEKLIPFGGIFFSITMISFGLDHFYYTKPISTMIPAWIPAHIFWTYFAAVALIGSGVSIILKIKDGLTATLLGGMILLWFIFLHIPGAFAHPFTDKGNEVTSAFSALAFSGIAFVIAGNRLRERQ